MMIKTEKAPATKKLAQAGEYRFASGTLFLPVFAFYSAIGKSNYANIRNVQARRGENLLQSELRQRVGIVEASEFFFFDSGDDAAIVEQSGCGAWPRSGDTENIHSKGSHCNWSVY